jgi:hypothetical protein
MQSSTSDYDAAALERFLSEKDGRVSAKEAPRLSARRSPPAALDGPGTPVLVWLVREQGTQLLLHLPVSEAQPRSVCTGVTQAGEATRAAGLRTLWECAHLRGPPDVEFLLRAGGAKAEAQPVGEGEAASYIALVRPERLRGGAVTPTLAFEPLDDVSALSKAQPVLFSPHFSAALGLVVQTLAPYARTAGRPGGLCAPPTRH